MLIIHYSFDSFGIELLVYLFVRLLCDDDGDDGDDDDDDVRRIYTALFSRP